MTTSVTKGGVEPSDLDTVISCRKRCSALPCSLTDSRMAAEVGERRLIERIDRMAVRRDR